MLKLVSDVIYNDSTYSVINISECVFHYCNKFTETPIISNNVTTMAIMHSVVDPDSHTSPSPRQSHTWIYHFLSFKDVSLYAEDGTTVLTETVNNLCRYTFNGTYLNMIIDTTHDITYNINDNSISSPIQSSIIKGGFFTVASYSGTKTEYSFKR